MEIKHFDNYMTTSLLKRSKKIIREELDNFLMPINFAKQGVKVMKKIENSKKIISNYLGVNKEEVKFVSDGVVGNNLIINSVVNYYLRNGFKYEDLEILIDKISCPDVILVYKNLEKLGLKINYINVDSDGNVLLDDLRDKLSKNTILVSITHVNHILGTVQNVEKVGEIIKNYNKDIFFHVDAQLSFLKYKIDLKNIDSYLFSSHKIGGPLISAFYLNPKSKIKNIFTGRGLGDFEVGFPNIPYICGFGEAVKIRLESLDEDIKYVKELRDYAYKEIMKNIDNVYLFGPSLESNRDFSNLLLSFKYVEGEAIFLDLSLDNIIVATTSACAHDETIQSNYVLLNIGKKHEESNSSLRITFSLQNTKKEVDYLVESLKKSVKRLRELSSFT